MFSLRAMGDTGFTLMAYQMTTYAAECAEISLAVAPTSVRPEAALGVGALLGLWTVAETFQARLRDAATSCAELASDWAPFLDSIDSVLATSPAPVRSIGAYDDLDTYSLEEIDGLLVWVDDEVASSGSGSELLSRLADSPRAEVRLALAAHLATIGLTTNSLVGIACRLVADSDAEVSAAASLLDTRRSGLGDTSSPDEHGAEDSLPSSSSSPPGEMKERDMNVLCICAAMSVAVELASVTQGLHSGEVHFIGLGWLLAVAGAVVYPGSKDAARAIEDQQGRARSLTQPNKRQSANRWTGLD